MWRNPYLRTFQQVSFVILLTALAGTTHAWAQPQEPATSVMFGAGAVNFDLSGTGTAPGFTARVSRDLGSGLVLEGGVLFAPIEQQFEDDSTLFVPEVQLQYRWLLGRFAPYVGGGVGLARVSSELRDAQWNAAVSFGGGTRIRVNERMGVFGELRIRGIEWDFVGTTSDVIGGIVIRLGR